MSSQDVQGSTSRRPLRAVLIVLVLGAIVFFGGRALGWWGKDDGDGTLKLYGNVEIREVELGFRVNGRIEELLVDEGDKVAAGQLLARLEKRPLLDRLANADARLRAATAGAERDANGNRPQEIRAAEAAVSDAQAALSEARRQYERRRALLDRGFMSRAEVQTAEAAVSAAAARVNAARAELSLMREGSRVEDRVSSQAQASAVMAERRAVQTDLSDTELRAAEAGQVLTRAREVGAIVQPGETVMTLALTQPVRVRAYVAEPDLPRVRPGMRVRVSVDGSDRSWPATIGFISSTAEFTPKTVQTEQLRTDLVYRLRLTVEDPRGELRQGQPVTVTLPSGGR